MMGYRDPNDNDDEREAERWDTVLHDFGVRAYIHERYMSTAEQKETAMASFTVGITFTKNVEVEVDEDSVTNAVDNEDFGIINDISVEDFTSGETVEVEVQFSGSIEVELGDLEELAKQEAERLLANESVFDFEVQTVDEN